MTITIPPGERVEFTNALLLMETPDGIVEGLTTEIRVGGRRWHNVENLTETRLVAMDMDTGELDTLVFDRWQPSE